VEKSPTVILYVPVLYLKNDRREMRKKKSSPRGVDERKEKRRKKGKKTFNFLLRFSFD
jgi:hypothetical protein